MKDKKEKAVSKADEMLAHEILDDFLLRQEERRSLEQQWNLNFNYLIGNQYCEISPNGEVGEEEKYYFWQNRNVYNHIAPIVETRVAKLARVRPKMSVRAAGSEDSDLKTAKVASDVLNSSFQRLGLDGVVSKATLWSEVLGTSFYKILWNCQKGKILGKDEAGEIREGDVSVIAVSPFEIYPDSLFHEDFDSVRSLIHARAMHVNDIEEIYGVRVEGEDVDVFKMAKAEKGSPLNSKIINGVVHNNALVIERYEKPSKKYPLGRVVTVAGGKVLCEDVLPYENGIDGRRDFPFVKQESITQPACFFGSGIIERIIPLQKAYNAVKNRKHEFINRLTTGVLAVEDGSIDTDELVEEGLSPGKVIVYRQGSNPPQMMSTGSVPIDFSYEEERLENEFITISGVSEISRNSSVPDSVTSGVAMQILLEQDETRLLSTAESIKRAIKLMAKHILRLFKQFATQTRMMRVAGESRKAEVFYFQASDIGSDDVVFDTENEISTTPAQKKSAVLELLPTGLLSDGNGVMDERTKSKILEIMGFGSLENANDLTQLHIAKADEENLRFGKGNVACEEFDNHEVHIVEHTRFLLSGEVDKSKNSEELKKSIVAHMREHKIMLQNEQEKNKDEILHIRSE